MLSKFKKRYLFPLVLVPVFVISTGFKDNFFEIAKQIEIFTTLYKTLNSNYVDEINPGDIMTKAIKNTLSELDPYTVFFNEQDVIKFKINGTGEYTGIGAGVKRIDGRLIIREPYKGYAADKAGLLAGDEIISIDGVKLIDFKENATELLKGSINTPKEIVYQRQGKNYNTTLKLEEVAVKAVPYYKLLDNNVGYIVLSQFNKKAGKEVKDALVALKKEGATKIILDLRNNPGGYLVEAVKIVNLFTPKDELVVFTKAKAAKHTMEYKTRVEPIDTEIPLAIIINKKSASASEIVSGALQDLDRAVVVGERSFGKGLVQRPINLVYDTQLKVTISRYYTPSGRCIQALDYTKKDKDGNAIKNSKSEFQSFTTKKGRTVYDGGGILPDVLNNSSTNASLTNLLDSDAVFDYATTYVAQHSDLKNQIPTITDQEYNQFKKSVEGKITSVSKSEKTLEKAIQQAKKEKTNQKTLDQYQQLLDFIQQEKVNTITSHKKEIEYALITELIKRYQYREGLYDYETTVNTDIIKAIGVLNNTSEYNKILQK